MLYILYSSSKVNIFSMQCNLQAYNLTKTVENVKIWYDHHSFENENNYLQLLSAKQ